MAVVFALVRAGGNLGAVIAGFCFYINVPCFPSKCMPAMRCSQHCSALEKSEAKVAETTVYLPACSKSHQSIFCRRRNLLRGSTYASGVLMMRILLFRVLY